MSTDPLAPHQRSTLGKASSITSEVVAVRGCRAVPSRVELAILSHATLANRRDGRVLYGRGGVPQHATRHRRHPRTEDMEAS